MDLKLFVIGVGERSGISPNFFGFHECMRTEEPRGGRGGKKNRGEVKMCRCCGTADTFHLSPPSSPRFLHFNKKQDFLDVHVAVRSLLLTRANLIPEIAIKCVEMG